jgi:phenylacetate-CoA ligase
MFLTSLHEFAAGAVFFPFTQYLYNRKRIAAHYRQALDSERLHPETLSAMQMSGLRMLLRHAMNRVPYYEQRFKEEGINPDRIIKPEDMRRIPPLSREDLVANRNYLVARRYRFAAARADASRRKPGEPRPFACFQRTPLIKNTSSGSTGAPTIFYEDGTVSATSWANELRLKQWFGLRPGVSEVRLVRVAPDFTARNKSNALRRLLWNQMILPGVNLTDKEYEFIAGELHEWKPKVLWAFTSAVAGLARYLAHQGTPSGPNRPQLIITWAAPLYDHERAIIHEAFGCPVSNIYGMREVGHIGAYCPAGSLHIFQESHFLETDDNGELLVTFLKPSPMPFIRYRTGDVGELTTEKCACGRTLQVIKHLHGRTGEIFTTEDGRMFSPNFWCRTFMDAKLAEAVKRFQIVYAKNQTIKIKLLADAIHRPEVENKLTAVVGKNFGTSTRVDFEYPATIAPSFSGKYQMVINERC